MNRTKLHRLVVGMALIGVGIVVGVEMPTSNEAHGEVRGTPPPDAFKTGGQLSVPVLKDIAATLHRIDGRIARLEAVAQKLQTPRNAPRDSD